MAYLTEDEFKERSTVPDSHVDELLELAPRWLDVNLEATSQFVDSRLRKRYAVPFAAPVPEQVKDWVARIIPYKLYLKRGIDPTDAEFSVYSEDYKQVLEELKEAANGEEGLFDLPLKGGSIDSSAITKSGCKSYSEQSVYVGPYSRSITAMDEDYNGSGTFYE